MSAIKIIKKILCLSLVFSMFVTMLPWANVNASESFTEKDLFEVYERFASVVHGVGATGWDVEDEYIFEYFILTDELQAYLDEESGNYVISYDDYIELVDSVFDAHSDMIDFLITNEYMDSENMIRFSSDIIDTEEEKVWVIPTYYYDNYYEPMVQGLVLYESDVYTESEVEDLVEFVDYVELVYSEEEDRVRIAEEGEDGWYVGISELSEVYFSQEGKVIWYEAIDHYTYKDCRYNYDYEGNFIDQRVLLNFEGEASIRDVDDSISLIEEQLQMYNDAYGYWAVLGTTVDFRLLAGGYIYSIDKVTYENSDGTKVLLPDENGVYTLTISEMNTTLNVTVKEDYEINDGVLTCRHPHFPTWYELKMDLDEHVKIRTAGGIRFYLDDKLYVASSENNGSAAWNITADLGYEIASVELAEPSVGTISLGGMRDTYFVKINAPTTLIVRTEKSTNNVTDVFVDINEGDWFKDAVQYVYDYGMMSGNDNVFDPSGEMTRAMMVSTLYRLDGSQEVTDYTATSIFGDVYSGAWFEDAVNWAYNEGISVGYPDTMQFGAYDSVTREQLASLLYRYADKNGYEVKAREDLTDYIGYSEISEYAKDSMSWAVSIGVISGIRSDVDGVVTYDLAPQGYATRAQLASILMRFCEYYGL